VKYIAHIAAYSSNVLDNVISVAQSRDWNSHTS